MTPGHGLDFIYAPTRASCPKYIYIIYDSQLFYLALTVASRHRLYPAQPGIPTEYPSQVSGVNHPSYYWHTYPSYYWHQSSGSNPAGINSWDSSWHPAYSINKSRQCGPSSPPLLDSATYSTLIGLTPLLSWWINNKENQSLVRIGWLKVKGYRHPSSVGPV